MSSSTTTAAGQAIPAGAAVDASATQAAWRFFNNPRVEFSSLAEPLREEGRVGCLQNESEFELLAHDCSKLDYAKHVSKEGQRQLTHEHDIDYDLTTALLIDAEAGSPLAPMQMHVRTADTVYSTSKTPPGADDHHLEQLEPMMEEVESWNLQRQETPEAEATKQLLVRLGSRRMKRGVPFTAPALLAGYFVMLSMCDLLEHTDYDLRKIKTLAANALPFLDTT